MYNDLNGKIALITGASRGFGKAIALRLAKEGCHVLLNYRRSKTEAEETAKEIEAIGGKVTLIKADVGKEEKINDMFKAIQSTFGKLDILIPNASFGIPGKILDATSRYWDITFDSTSKSLLLMARLAVPLMKDGGKIITITSYGGQRVLEDYGVVGPAKAAVEGLTRSLSVECAPLGITVNGVMPGLSDTKSLRAIPGAEEALENVRLKTPMNRLVTADEVANVVAFLSSNQGNMIVGQFIIIDGGAFIK